ERTGFVIGGIPPVGHVEPLVCVIDEDLLHHEVIWAAAGTPHAVFQLTPADLLRITAGRVACVKGVLWPSVCVGAPDRGADVPWEKGSDVSMPKEVIGCGGYHAESPRAPVYASPPAAGPLAWRAGPGRLLAGVGTCPCQRCPGRGLACADRRGPGVRRCGPA